MKTRWVLVVLAIMIAACGGSDDDGTTEAGDAEAGAGDAAAVGESDSGSFDTAELPDGFPSDLIPPSFDSSSVLALGGQQTVTFESTTPVDDTIAHYTDALGAPTNAAEGDTGEKTAQWQTGEWLLSVIGSGSESIVGFTQLDA